MEPVRMPITDELDLHAFSPKDVKNLLEDYFEECIKAKIYSVRVIHGKGTGALARSVHSLLSKSAMVDSSALAPPQAGGWGATRVQLKKREPRQ